MSSGLYPWQLSAWTQIQQMRGRWPHAILLHGQQGTGKTVFAELLAQSLLCENTRDDGMACGTCVSCGWFVQYNHPDYRRLRPESLETEPANEGESGEAAGEGGDGGEGGARATKGAARSSKAPSREILIGQVRGLADFLTVTTHRRGMRVITVYPAEAMNVAASNALLKSLEEPGPGTVFILVTNSIDGLLPTVVSRCRQFALPMPELAQALAWLQEQKIARPEQLLAEHGGAPLAAAEASQAESVAEQELFLMHLQRPGLEAALKVAEKLQKTSIPLILSWMQRWLYDVFCFKLTGKIRYYPRYQNEIRQIAASISMSGILDLLDSTTQRRMVAEHPLAARLVIEDMLLDYDRQCQRRD